MPAIHYAIRLADYEELLRFLVIECQADINVIESNENRPTALTIASTPLCRLDVVKCLLELGADCQYYLRRLHDGSRPCDHPDQHLPEI